MPNSAWTVSGNSLALTPSTSPITDAALNSPDYLTNADKIALMAEYAAELATKTQLDSQAVTAGVPSTFYDSTVAQINTTLVDAGAPSNWATIWPDGTTSGPWIGIKTNLASDWASIATARAELQGSILSSANAITFGTLDASLVNVTNLNASNITTGTLSASQVVFSDGSTLSSAPRSQVVSNSPSTATTVAAETYNQLPSPYTTYEELSGLGVTVNISALSDALYLSAYISATCTGGTVFGATDFLLVIDGTPAPSTAFVTLAPPSGTGVTVTATIFASVLALSPGAHTFQYYGSIASGYDNIMQVNTASVFNCLHTF